VVGQRKKKGKEGSELKESREVALFPTDDFLFANFSTFEMSFQYYYFSKGTCECGGEESVENER